MSAAAPEELPLGDALGDDALELVQSPPRPDASSPASDLGSEQPLEAYLDDEPPTREVPAVREDSPTEPEPERAPDTEEPAAEAAPDLEPEPAAQEPPARRPAKKKGRASVPSWDEIMFGGGKSE